MRTALSGELLEFLGGQGLDEDPVGLWRVRIDVGRLCTDAQIMAALVGVSLSAPDLDPDHGGPRVSLALVFFEVGESHDGNLCSHHHRRSA
jgi:hypothetical protein